MDKAFTVVPAGFSQEWPPQPALPPDTHELPWASCLLEGGPAARALTPLTSLPAWIPGAWVCWSGVLPSASAARAALGEAVPPWAFDCELLLVTQMSWANLRAAFPALSPAQLHRLLTQYQLASAMGPMSAWEPGVQDSPDAFKSGKPSSRQEQGP